MLIEILGSGGAIATPQPGCGCLACTQARERGVPYSRTGPSYFVHGPDVLIDTPEEARLQLDRAAIAQVPACIYSHWHPDHTAGRRVFEHNLDFRAWPAITTPTEVYLPQQVAADSRLRLGMWEQLAYMESREMVRVHVLADGEVLTRNGVTIRPFRLHEDYVYAFLLEDNGRRALIAPDELHAWQPPDELQGIDLAILPMGIPEFDPFSGQRLVPSQHPVLQTEATFAETLAVVRQLKPRRVVLSHLEEPFRLTFDGYRALADQLQRQEGLAVTFAYDTMRIEV
jgi:phosphoribosyl 1,2-cyclic phosphate phosphodiesterase